jgi:small GTP-binding protein
MTTEFVARRERAASFAFSKEPAAIADGQQQQQLLPIVKLVMVGDSGVGKTCLLLRFADDAFTPSFITTVGIDFKIRTVVIEGRRLKLQVWDTAGQERFRTITSAYYRNAMGVIIAYSVTDALSFAAANDWYAEVRAVSHDSDLMLVGTKCDATEGERAVKPEAGKAWALEHGAYFLETSAKDNVNVDACFVRLARMVKKRLLDDSQQQPLPNDDTAAVVVVAPTAAPQPRRRC